MADRGLGDFKTFRGELGVDESKIAVTFEARIDDRGEVGIKLPPLPLDKDTYFIRQHHKGDRQRVGYFHLRGVADDGTKFRTEHLHIRRYNEHWSVETDSSIDLELEVSHGSFERTLEEPIEAPVLKHWLKGFECFPRLHATCPLGRVVMAGQTKLEEPDTLTGWIVLQADEAPHDHQAWRDEAGKLLDHVRRVMSFAASTILRSPVIEYAAGSDTEITIYSQSRQSGPSMRTFHKLDQQSIFDAAVRAFFDPPVETRDLFYALEWFSMTATYNEVRLVNAMTALENLLDSHLPEEGVLLMPPKEFEKTRKVLRGVIRDCLAKWPPEKLDDDTLQALNEKLADLNRRSLRTKLYRLAQQWNVPLDGISEAQVKAAISARNSIVHTGHHHKSPEDERLWDHVTLAREIVVRFFLTAMGFRGRYISHLGGYHDAMFPPEPE